MENVDLAIFLRVGGFLVEFKLCPSGRQSRGFPRYTLRCTGLLGIGFLQTPA